MKCQFSLAYQPWQVVHCGTIEWLEDPREAGLFSECDIEVWAHYQTEHLVRGCQEWLQWHLQMRILFIFLGVNTWIVWFSSTKRENKDINICWQKKLFLRISWFINFIRKDHKVIADYLKEKSKIKTTTVVDVSRKKNIGKMIVQCLIYVKWQKEEGQRPPPVERKPRLIVERPLLHQQMTKDQNALDKKAFNLKVL